MSAPRVQLVILVIDEARQTGHGSMDVFIDDPERAEQLARNTGSLIVELGVTHDFRPDPA